MKNPGTLYIIAAPSGAGKTSLVNALIKELDRIKVSVSYTTRPQRPAEENGRNYHFVSHVDFETMVEKGVFLEHALVHGNYYGTSQHWVLQQLQAGFDVILEIDWQGAQQARVLFPGCVGIFILPPSRRDLELRLEKRQQDAATVITKRLEAASEEISHFAEFDYLVVNDEFHHAVDDLKAIIRAQRLRLSHQATRQVKLLESLLKSA